MVHKQTTIKSNECWGGMSNKGSVMTVYISPVDNIKTDTNPTNELSKYLIKISHDLLFSGRNRFGRFPSPKPHSARIICTKNKLDIKSQNTVRMAIYLSDRQAANTSDKIAWILLDHSMTRTGLKGTPKRIWTPPDKFDFDMAIMESRNSTKTTTDSLNDIKICQGSLRWNLIAAMLPTHKAA